MKSIRTRIKKLEKAPRQRPPRQATTVNGRRIFLSLEKAMRLRLALEVATQDARRFGVEVISLRFNGQDFEVRFRRETVAELKAKLKAKLRGRS